MILLKIFHARAFFTINFSFHQYYSLSKQNNLEKE